MGRLRLSLFAVLLPLAVSAQWGHIGLKLNADFSERLNTGTKNYYFASYGTASDGTVRGFKVKNVPALEVFARYDHYDRYFLQAGVASFKNKYDIDFKSNDDGSIDDIDALFAQQYVTAGKLFSAKSAIKPYVTAGLAFNFLLDYSNAHTYIGGVGGNWARDEVVVRDLHHTFNRVVVMGKIGAGLKYYALHVELSVSRNVTKLDSSDADFYKSWLVPQFSIGYNFISFNTVKKKEH